MANKKQRQIEGFDVRDPSIIDNLKYNEPAGADKNLSVGPKLLPLPASATTFTTDASTKKVLPKGGCNLAIYNKDTALHAVTIGDSTVTAQAAGAVQSSTNFVGIPCPPGAWTYVSCGNNNNVVTDNNNLLVFIIDDSTYMTVEAKTISEV